VVKIGSSLLYTGEDKADMELIGELTGQIAGLSRQGKELVLVSSGAIALGMSVLGLDTRPKGLSYLQAAAAVGQNELMDFYRRHFKARGLSCAQVLLTWDDLSGRKRYLNAKNTIFTLLKLESIPIINENDTVATDEIRFGDNDRLSALVSSLVGADLLIILSDVDGLLDKDRKTLVKVITQINPQIKGLASTTDKKTCVGGMITKIEAAKIAVDSGIPCVIANGRQKDILLALAKDINSAGTLFVPKTAYLAAKKRWLAFGTKPKGRIEVDDGARQALLNKKSLLSVGITACAGGFEAGDIVSIVNKDSLEVARGKVNVSSRQLDKIKGARHDKEVVHRDNIAIL